MDFTSGSLRFRLVFAGAAVSALLAGCPAEDGDVCFRDGDCSSGLQCCKTSTSPTARGRCGTLCDSVPDGGPRIDAGLDGGPDGGGVDANVDAGVPDGGGLACTFGDATCGVTAFCRVSGCAGGGMCADLPTDCPAVVDPVCACDGRTFLNECEANAAGQNTAASGECSAVDAGAPDGGADGG